MEKTSLCLVLTVIEQDMKRETVFNSLVTLTGADRPKIEGKNNGRGNPLQQTGTQELDEEKEEHCVQNAVQSGRLSAEPGTSEGDNSGLVGLTTQQWQTQVELLNAQKTNSNDKMTGECDTNAWIIDTGASTHMTGNLNHMCEVHDIQSCPVGLPNGQHTAAIKEGSVVFDGGLKITNGLYVPKLNCNLISVS